MSDPIVDMALRHALLLAARLAGPALIAALAAGLLVSLLQTVTQINEPSLVFLPKVAAVFGAIMVTGGFIEASLNQFAHNIFTAMIHIGLS